MSSKHLLPHLRDDDKQQCQDTYKKWVNKCRYCRDKWSPGNKCSNPKSYSYEAERELDTLIDFGKNSKRKENNCCRC